MLNENQFNTKLDEFKKATATSMEVALELSVDAMTTFVEHGNLNKLNALHDAMPKNYLRRGALVAWIDKFSPVQVDAITQKVIVPFLKDKSENAKAFNLEGALEKSFWEFKPETPHQAYGGDDIGKALWKTLTKFDGDKWDSGSEFADITLERAKVMVQDFINDLKNTDRTAEANEAVDTAVTEIPYNVDEEVVAEAMGEEVSTLSLPNSNVG